MARKSYNLRVTKDGAVTVIVGRHRESFSLEGKTKAELFEAIKWSLISKDVFLSDATLAQDIWELKL